jgi:hypothetical protein
MRTDIMARLPYPSAHRRIAFERNSSGKERALNVEFVKEPQEAPDTGASTVFINRLERQVTELMRHSRAGKLPHALIPTVARPMRILGPLFEIDN